jgi:hypothetical protein
MLHGDVTGGSKKPGEVAAGVANHASTDNLISTATNQKEDSMDVTVVEKTCGDITGGSKKPGLLLIAVLKKISKCVGFFILFTIKTNWMERGFLSLSSFF